MKISQLLDEVSLGNYQSKAQKAKALAQMGAAFAPSPEERQKQQDIARKRERGLERVRTRNDKAAAAAAAQRKAEYEQSIRDKYAGVDIDAEIAKLKPAMQRAYDDYQYGASNTYSDARDEYQRLQAKIRELQSAKEILQPKENASVGATGSGSISSGHGRRNPDSLVV